MRGAIRTSAIAIGAALAAAVTVMSVPALGVVGGTSPTPDETLTYVAVTPCAVFDSRASQGATGAFVGPYLGDKVGGFFQGVNNKTLQVTGTFPSGQGGGNTTCGIPATARAVHINIVAANPLTAGNLVVADAGGAPPSGGIVNYQVQAPLLNNSNAFNVPLSSGGALDVYANCGDGCTAATVQARGVVNGYWVPGVDVYESFDRTVVIGGSGTDVENGTAFRNAVAAVDAQSPTAADPWLIKLEPGTFNLGVNILILGGNINIQGSGADATTIVTETTAEGLRVLGDTEISDVTVISPDGAAATVSVLGAVVVNIRDAVIEKHNPTSTNGLALRVNGGAQVTITGSRITATGTSVEAILAEAGDLEIYNSQIEAVPGNAIFSCCQGALETASITVRGSTIIGTRAVSNSAIGTSVDISESRLQALGTQATNSVSLVVVRNSTVLGTMAGTGTRTCVAIAQATTFLADTCP